MGTGLRGLRPLASRLRMRRVSVLVTLAGLACLPLLPASTLVTLVGRVLPVLGFLVTITLVSDLCDRAGLFDAGVDLCARLARGRTWALVALLTVLGTLATWTLSLDATAVLLTPVALRAARRLELPALPLALLCVWLANTASLLLPAANLTNLLAQERLQLDAPAFLQRTWLPQAAMLLVLALWFVIRFGRTLPARFQATVSTEPAPNVALVTCAAVTAAVLAGAVVAGAPAWLASTVAAVVLAVAHLARGRHRTVAPHRLLRVVPWEVMVLASGLFVVMTAASPWLLATLRPLVGTGGDGWAHVRVAGVAAVGANLVNNLPAYLAVEPVAGSPSRLLAVLVGVGAGPSMLLWGSLANLLWWQRCRGEGLCLPAARFLLEGLPVVLLTVLAGALML